MWETLREINALLQRLNATTLNLDKTLRETTLHPAGYLTFFSLLNNRFGGFPFSKITLLDVGSLTGQDLLDMIDDHQDNQ